METLRETRKQRRRRQAKDDIVEAAIAVIQRDGTAGFTMASVAAEAGVSKPSVYYYFDNRDAVIWDVARVWSTRAAREVVAALDGLEGPDAAEAVVRTWVGLHASRLELFRAVNLWTQLGGDSSAEVGKQIEGEMNAMFGTIEAALVGSLPEGVSARRYGVNVWTAAYGLLGMLSLLESTGQNSAHAIDDLVESCVGMVRRGCTA